VRFEVLTVARMKMAVFWGVAPCTVQDVLLQKLSSHGLHTPQFCLVFTLKVLTTVFRTLYGTLIH
jgi:hypothetical protein